MPPAIEPVRRETTTFDGPVPFLSTMTAYVYSNRNKSTPSITSPSRNLSSGHSSSRESLTLLRKWPRAKKHLRNFHTMIFRSSQAIKKEEDKQSATRKLASLSLDTDGSQEVLRAGKQVSSRAVNICLTV